VILNTNAQACGFFLRQAWLTMHYGMVENRDFGKQIIQYLNLLNMLVPRDQAATPPSAPTSPCLTNCCATTHTRAT